ncbi:MAG: capsule assembly Wzi family protein [Gammaproteobacteria bacterium]
MSTTQLPKLISDWSEGLLATVRQPLRFLGLTVLMLITLNGLPVYSAPYAETGDIELRHDLEYLADRGLISIPITTWPMSWADIAAAVDSVNKSSIKRSNARAVYDRLVGRVARNTRWGELELSYTLGASENRTALRTFADRPRGSVDIAGKVEYTGEKFAVNLKMSLVNSSDDSQDLRLDGSYVGRIFGNYSVTFGSQDAWWGPGHAGSLILSSNARPVPRVSVRRHEAIPFRSPILRWIGPWSFHGFVGRLESNRPVSQPYLLGLRVTAKPFRSLELGVSRTAQWGGAGRTESLDSLVNLILGRDNVGDGIDASEEPGNQLAGFDARWSINRWSLPLTLYGQLIGEDEAGGFPSRYLGQGGASVSFPGLWAESTVRMNLEYSDTTCQFHENSKLFNCAYNTASYPAGYRYRGRALGHSTDNDSSQIALLTTLNTGKRHSWLLTLRSGRLNRGGPPDPNNSLTEGQVDYVDFDLQHNRPLFNGMAEFGIGLSNSDVVATNSSTTDARAFVRWHSVVR